MADVNTTYVDSNGVEQKGINRDGRTLDANGNEIQGGYSVKTADGSYWQKNADGTSSRIDETTYRNSIKTPAPTTTNTPAANRLAAEAAVAGEQARQTSVSQQPSWSDAQMNALRNGDTSGVDNYNFTNTNAHAGYDDRGRYHTTIYGADGKTYDGYIYNGATYYANGDRLSAGDRVVAADGQVHTMDNKQAVKYDWSSDDFNNWLNEDGHEGRTAFTLRNDWEGFKAGYDTDKYGQNVRNGNIQMWPDGTIQISDGLGNLVGSFDSAGTFHPNTNVGGTETNLGEYGARVNSWEDAARKMLGEMGVKFTGNGMEWNQRDHYATSGGDEKWLREHKYLKENNPDYTFVANKEQLKTLPPGTKVFWYGNEELSPEDFPDGLIVKGRGNMGSFVSGGGTEHYDFETGDWRNYYLGPEIGWVSGKDYATGAYNTGGASGDRSPVYASGNGASGAPGNYGTGTPTQSSGISPEIAKLLEGLGTTGNTTNLGTTYSTNYILPNYTAEDIARWQQGGNRGDTGAGTTVNVEGIKAPEAPDLKPMLDEWRANEELRQQRSIDYATDQGATNFQRAEEDAQQGFRTAQEQIARDEAAARDNQALYAEARGDKGGIGAAQYDSIANTAAINRQNVRDSQIKLSTDTARQIEDLRNQGEFKKADALLQISQEYLSNLMSLEQWAANYGLNAAQFEEAIREWEQNFKLNVANITGELNGVQTLAARNADRDFAMNLMNYDLNRTNADRNYELNRTNSDRDWAMNLMNYDLNRTNADRNFRLSEANVTGYYNGQPTYAKTNADRNFELEKTNADRNFRLNEANVTGTYNGAPTYAATKQNTSNLSSIGMSMLQSGIMPSTDMLRAMGISDADAQAYLMGLQAKSASKGGGTYYYTPPIDLEDTDSGNGKVNGIGSDKPMTNEDFNRAASGILSNAKDGRHTETQIVAAIQAIAPSMTDQQFAALQYQLGQLGIEISK